MPPSPSSPSTPLQTQAQDSAAQEQGGSLSSPSANTSWFQDPDWQADVCSGSKASPGTPPGQKMKALLSAESRPTSNFSLLRRSTDHWERDKSIYWSPVSANAVSPHSSWPASLRASAVTLSKSCEPKGQVQAPLNEEALADSGMLFRLPSPPLEQRHAPKSVPASRVASLSGADMRRSLGGAFVPTRLKHRRGLATLMGLHASFHRRVSHQQCSAMEDEAAVRDGRGAETPTKGHPRQHGHIATAQALGEPCPDGQHGGCSSCTPPSPTQTPQCQHTSQSSWRALPNMSDSPFRQGRPPSHDTPASPPPAVLVATAADGSEARHHRLRGSQGHSLPLPVSRASSAHDGGWGWAGQARSQPSPLRRLASDDDTATGRHAQDLVMEPGQTLLPTIPKLHLRDPTLNVSYADLSAHRRALLNDMTPALARGDDLQSPSRQSSSCLSELASSPKPVSKLLGQLQGLQSDLAAGAPSPRGLSSTGLSRSRAPVRLVSQAPSAPMLVLESSLAMSCRAVSMLHDARDVSNHLNHCERVLVPGLHHKSRRAGA